MDKLDTRLQALLEEFTVRLRVIIEEETQARVREVFEEARLTVSKRRAPKRPATPSKPRASKAASSAKGTRRTPSKVRSSRRSKVSESDVLTALAGSKLRSEELAKALQTSTKELRPVLQRLLGEGTLKATGKARGTQYEVSGDKPKASGANSEAKKKARVKKTGSRKASKRSKATPTR